ncbi:MAG: hypothetical protein V3V21_03710, partial [Thermoplasmata archaeon]
SLDVLDLPSEGSCGKTLFVESAEPFKDGILSIRDLAQQVEVEDVLLAYPNNCIGYALFDLWL